MDNALSSNNTNENRRSVANVRIRLRPSEKSGGIPVNDRGDGAAFFCAGGRWPNAGDVMIVNAINV